MPSLVNSAQNEHFNVTEAVRTDAPLTSNKSVISSINFENSADGAYVVRKPLIKKTDTTNGSWILYDNESILTLTSFSLAITGKTSINITVQFYDKDLVLRKITYPTNATVPFMEIYKAYNAPDHTILSVKLSNMLMYYMYGHILVDAAMHYNLDPQITLTNYQSIYRFVKIYKNLDTEEEGDWIVEIVHPEFNSITSGLDSDNPESLDINMLLDNPYAVRDLYGYGYNSTTKILAYVPLQYSKAQIDELRVIDLTEDVPFTYQGSLKGFKMLVSSNPVDIYGNMIVLKACLTTAITNLTYYCCWEQSINGIDWETCPEFISKFQSNTNNTLIEKNVSDITSAEFEKIAYNDSLEKAATYLVTKKMVKLNTSTSTDLAATNKIKDRPDVLILENPNLNLKFRFLVYVDTGKASPVPNVVEKTFTKSYFESLGNTETNLDELGKFTFQTYIGNGVDADVPSGQTPAAKNPELSGGSILLYESGSTNWGNYVVIKNKEPDYCIKEVRVTLDNKTFHAADTNHPTNYYTENGSKIKYYNGTNNQIGTTNVTSGTALNKFLANETTVIPVNSNTNYFPGTSQVSFGNDAANIPSDELGSDGKWQWRTKIKSLEIVYWVKGGVQSTSVYLSSQTGTYQVPYSKATEYLEDLSLLRKQLFAQSEIYYNKEQFLFYGNNTVFVTDLGSSIIRLMNTMTFGNPVNAIVSFRNYLLAFTDSTITLLKYNSLTNSYDSKLLTTSIGVSKVDAKTIAVILNSIYFKSKYRVYRLIPNLYASTDDILNIHTVSAPVDKILEEVISLNTELGNFVYADADTYMLFVPLRNIDSTNTVTYEFRYDFTKKLWTIQEYPILASGIECPTINEAYLKTESALYYFKEDLATLLNATLVQDYSSLGYLDDNDNDAYLGVSYSIVGSGNVTAEVALSNSSYTSLSKIYDYIPYGDYLSLTLLDIYSNINNNSIQTIVIIRRYVRGNDRYA